MVRSELLSQYLTLTSNAQIKGHASVGAAAAPNVSTILYPGTTFETPLMIEEEITSTSVNQIGGLNNFISYNPSSDASAVGVYLLDNELQVPASNAQNFGALNGIYTSINHFGSGSIGQTYGMFYSSYNQGAGSIGDAYGIYGDMGVNSTGDITTGYGIYSRVINTGGGGTISTGYGLYIASIQATSSYGVFQSDTTNKNYFAGNVGIKTSSPGSELDVKGQIRLSGATSGYVGIASPASPTSYSLVLPSAQGAANTFLRNDGSGNLSFSTAASNTWQSTIAYSTDSYSADGVNAPADAISFTSGMPGQTHYLATDDNNGTVGDGTPTPLGIIAGSYTGTGTFTSITGAELDLLAGANHQTGASIGQVTGGNLNLYAGTAVGSGDGGQITINGGNATHGGNGNGGPILIETGIPCGTGVRGSMTLTSSVTQMNSPVMILPTATSDASGAAQAWLYYNTVTNQVRIHDATVWKDFGTTGANTALSNLTNPTAVNQILNDTNSLKSLDLTNRILFDSSELFSLSYDTRSLIDSAGNQAMDYQNRLLTYSSGQASVDYANSTLFDTSNLQALNYQNRILSYASGGASLDWQNSTLFDTTNQTALNYNSRVLIDFTGHASVYWESRILSDSSGNDSLKYNDRTLMDPTGVISADWSVRSTYDSSATQSIDYENRSLLDSAGNQSVDYENRILYDSAVNPSVDWSTSGIIDLNTNVIKSPAGGSGTVPTLTTSYTVTDGRVTTNSQVIVTLQTASASVVQSVIPSSGSFSIRLTASVVATLNFKYTIMEFPA